MKKCHEFVKNVERINRIGLGGFGGTWKVKIGNQVYTEKVYKINGWTPYDITSEIRVFTQDAPEYFPKLLYSGFTMEMQWCTIMEYVDGGTLLDHTQSKISPEAFRTIFYQMALGLEWLHGKDFTHG